MRYLIITYYRKADGKIDESTAVAKNLKTRDLQTANVILDFKELKVVRARLADAEAPKDWDRVVAFYHQYYPHIVERLFKENGYEIVKDSPETTDSADESDKVA